MNAPVLIFTYKRLNSLKSSISSLQKNTLAEESELYIFSDAPKSVSDNEDVKSVRSYLKTINGFKKINIIEANENKGLASAIINGITEVLKKYDRVIVLEDDLILSSNFLIFMNKALSYYENESKVLSISGFTMPMKGLQDNDIYFTQRSASWGWATWRNRWDKIDWEARDYLQFQKSRRQRQLFNKMGSDLTSMLNRQMKGEIDSWAIRFYYHQFKYKLYTVYPAISKVINIGLENDKNATHTAWQKVSRFKTVLDKGNISSFNFKNNIQLDNKVLKQFLKQHSIYQRIKYRLINILLGSFK